MRELITNSTAPMVVDADGINSIKGDADILKKAKSPVILTPHAGEMARLLKRDGSDDLTKRTAIDNDRIGVSLSFSKKTGAYLVLKGSPTVIAEPGGRVFINTTGNPGMATAGSGDVLTGILTGLMAQGYKAEEAARLGVYLHGLAGDLALDDQSEESLIAGDIIAALGKAFKKLK